MRNFDSVRSQEPGTIFESRVNENRSRYRGSEETNAEF